MICGLLGPNGSGKTTSIRMIMGILGPDEGTVSLFGENPDVTRRTKVGYLPEERGVYKKMKCLELITFLGEIRGLKRSEARRRGGTWLDRLGLPDQAPEEMIGTIAAITLPDATGGRFGTDALQQRLRETHRIEVPIMGPPVSPRRVLRISAQLYNEPAHYRALADALAAELAG